MNFGRNLLGELVTKFYMKKLRDYVEPQRKGTPKGLPIGFSIVKYQATFHMLRNIKLKEMAKDLGVSYGVLRKWNTEKDFKAIVKKNHEEFDKFMAKEFIKEMDGPKIINEILDILRKPIISEKDRKLAIKYLLKLS